MPRVKTQKRSDEVQSVYSDECDQNKARYASTTAKEGIEERFTRFERDLVLDRLSAESPINKISS